MARHGTVFDASSVIDASIAGAAQGVRSQGITFTGLVNGQPVVSATATMQWKVLDSANAVVAAGAGNNFVFAPTAIGHYTVMFGIYDPAQGHAGIASSSLDISVTLLMPDSAHPGQFVLLAGGTTP